MSDDVTPTNSGGIRQQLATRWQVPLFVVACALFGAGLWRLRPPPPPKPTFEQEFKQIVALHQDRRYVEASRVAEILFNVPDRKPEERRQLHRILGDIIYDVEKNVIPHNPVNLERMIQHYRSSVVEPSELDADTHFRLAKAWEWMDRPSEAAREYQIALEGGAIENVVSMRRHILDLRLQTRSLEGEQLAEELDSFLRAALKEENRSTDVMWAAFRRIIMYFEENKVEEADAFLESLQLALPPDAPEPDRNLYDFLKALITYRQKQNEQAERILRELRNRMTVRDTVDAASGWLLASLIQQHSSPQAALSMYETVLATHFKGPFVMASRLGRAETLMQLDRYEEAADAYREYLALLRKQAKISRTESSLEKEVDSSQRQWTELFYAAGLDTGDNLRQQIVYTERLAELVTKLADRELQRIDPSRVNQIAATQPSAAKEIVARQVSAHGYLLEAGQLYLRLSGLLTDRETESAVALWKAANLYDRSGERETTVRLLEQFIKDRPGSPRVAEALLRVGQCYQALNRYEEAIARYKRAVTEFPRTPTAIASLVPLAECYMATGPQHDRDAERTLLTVLEESPERPPIITPEATVFRDALFKIADLYMQTKQYDRAILRLEEARTRYPEDPRLEKARFQMAEAYRLSAADLPAHISDPKNEPRRRALAEDYRRRLRRAAELYNEVITEDEAHNNRSSRNELLALCVRLSYFYRADCVFDEQLYVTSEAAEGYSQAIRLYNMAALKYRTDPLALGAYIQTINAYLRLGNTAKARTSLEQARWILNGISDDSALWQGSAMSKQSWTSYLAVLKSSPMFREGGG